MKAKEYTQNLTGCELNEERYALAKCNFILNDLDYSNLYFNNCFNHKFSSYDHIIMNPPFSCTSSDNGENKDIYGFRNFKNEQRFCLYQLQYLKDGGTGCWIIPRSNFNNTAKKTNQFKQILLNNLRILKIINCNSKVFMPAASVECTIIIFKKEKVKEDYETEIINYTDDGYEIKKKQRIKTHEPKPESYNIILKAEDDWNYSKTDNIINNEELKQIIYYYNINKNYTENLIKLKKGIFSFGFINYIEYKEVRKWKQIKISDYFDIIKGYKSFKIQNSENGIYPLITRSNINNGIAKYINDYSLDGEYLTIAPNGSSGSTFYHSGKFAVDGMLKVLKLKEDKILDLNLFALVCNNQLTKLYNYNNGLTLDKINNSVINYPIFI